MVIRKILENDYSQVYNLIKETVTQVLSKDYSPAIVENMVRVDANRPHETAHERDYFVAVNGEDILGIIGIKQNEIKTFFVKTNLRGQGIGTKLLAFAEHAIRSHGYREATVYSTISGRTFYERCGFVFIGENNDIKIGTEIMKRFSMKKNLV